MSRQQAPGRGTRQAGAPGWFVVPALTIFAVFAIVPLFGVVVLSFTSWDGINPISFSGLASWAGVLTDPVTGNALWVTAKIMAISYVVQTPISLVLGIFVAGKQRYRAVLAVLYFVPLLLSSAAVAIAFKALLDPNFGLGAGLGVPALAQDWLGNPDLVLFVVVFVIAWQFVPFHTLIYQGGVQQIPASLYEAGQLDVDGRRIPGVLRSYLRPDGWRAGVFDPDLTTGYVSDRVQVQRYGSCQRIERDSGCPGSRPRPAPSATRW